MIRRLLWAALVAVAVTVAPVAAQAPAGWRVHTDPSQNAQDPDNTPNLTFAAMGKGFHVVSGPAGTFWHPSNTANGSYMLRGDVQPDGAEQPHQLLRPGVRRLAIWKGRIRATPTSWWRRTAPFRCASEWGGK